MLKEILSGERNIPEFDNFLSISKLPKSCLRFIRFILKTLGYHRDAAVIDIAC